MWRQAARYGVPCVAFVNKLDREGASVDATLASMRERLGARPVLLQVRRRSQRVATTTTTAAAAAAAAGDTGT